MIRCSVCGMEYSYGRILIHECGAHLIQHGFLFEDMRKCYEWNPNPVIKSSRPEIKIPKTNISKNISSFEKDYSKLEERNLYHWNCQSAKGLNNSPISEKNLNCYLIYE